jgi:hypothetical protein
MHVLILISFVVYLLVGCAGASYTHTLGFDYPPAIGSRTKFVLNLLAGLMVITLWPLLVCIGFGADMAKRKQEEKK